jgi:phosphoglycerol transferase MdoB-like AlkP superfamily enzyme
MMPHPPLLFDSSGKENAVRDMYAYNGMEQTTKKYVAYIKYSNDRLKEYVKMILDRTGGNAVIILQGDHGYREFSDRFPDEVRQGILNAIYLPNKNYKGMNDTMTPIQTFKRVLENQFNYQY